MVWWLTSHKPSTLSGTKYGFYFSNYGLEVKTSLKFLYMSHVFEKAASMDTLRDKVSSFLKGPSWYPGTGRLGDRKTVPEVLQNNQYKIEFLKLCVFL